MAGIPFLLVRVVRSLDCRLATSWLMVKFLSEVFFEIVTSRAGPSCFKLPGLNHTSTVISLDCLRALSSLRGGRSEVITVPFMISNEPFVRLVFPFALMRRSKAGFSPERSFTIGPSIVLKS